MKVSWGGREVSRSQDSLRCALMVDSEVLAWQAGVFVAEEISMHKDMQVNQCGGSQALQVV